MFLPVYNPRLQIIFLADICNGLQPFCERFLLILIFILKHTALSMGVVVHNLISFLRVYKLNKFEKGIKFYFFQSLF